MPPVFTSFAEAWRWFRDGGELTPLEEQRARFTEGRGQFLAFVAPLTADDAIARVADLQDALGDIDALSMTPHDELHVTVLGVGFQVIEKHRPNDVLRQEVAIIADRAAPLLRSTAPLAVSLGPVGVFPDALILEAHDDGALAGLHARLAQTGASDAFGFGDAAYLPHVTIASFRNGDAGDALRARLPALRDTAPVLVTLARVELWRAWFTGVDPDTSPEIDVVRSYALRGTAKA